MVAVDIDILGERLAFALIDFRGGLDSAYIDEVELVGFYVGTVVELVSVQSCLELDCLGNEAKGKHEHEQLWNHDI